MGVPASVSLQSLCSSPHNMRLVSSLASVFFLSTVPNTLAQDSCSSSQVCIPIRDCEDATELILEAQTTTDNSRKNHIVQLLRGRVCGRKVDRSVCCESGVQIDTKSSSQEETGGLRKLGSFRNFFHDISGDAYKVDSNTILIKRFTYDGEGPDTFFLAGTSGKPSRSGEYVLPYPDDGQKYTYNDQSLPLIKRSFDGSDDITLTLPPGESVDDLKWISVWCRAFNINFGHVQI